MAADCILTLMVARTDVLFLESILSHIATTLRSSVDAIVVFVDTAPLGPAYRDRPGVGTLDELRGILSRLQSSGVIDEIRDISYSRSVRRRLYQKYFGCDLKVTHNFRGYPVLGSIYSIDSVDSEYVVHFDSDMLIHQAVETSWIKEGVELLKWRDEIMFVSPRSGPPTLDDRLQQRDVKYTKEEGFYSFKEFTSRKYLFPKHRLEQLLPIKPQYISLKRKLLQGIIGKSALWNWEVMVSRALEGSQFVRADLMSKDAWTIHTPDHGPEFVKHLPEIIEKVEAGWYPPSQAGDYDLQLNEWLDK